MRWRRSAKRFSRRSSPPSFPAAWRAGERGFTLIEFLLGGLVLAIAITAILGAYIGQVTLNEHARNLSLAIQDANRVIEQIRQDTASGCTALNLDAEAPSGAGGSGTRNLWNTWMNAQNLKSIQPTPNTTEVVMVTCQNNTTAAIVDCDTDAAANPLRVTVAVCWRHRNRVIGECNQPGGVLTESDLDGDGVFESPAMLTTLVTCRG